MGASFSQKSALALNLHLSKEFQCLFINGFVRALVKSADSVYPLMDVMSAFLLNARLVLAFAQIQFYV